ncbi:MAG: energy-coupling factor transport system ATP-binding protein [Sphingomonadales bacterium]|jgi:energy-coupling factor transport system ATP-binding protein|nr:energy-coupling factor transport system ATP-binding protein [Sphingomonadales bacterium]
MMTFYDGPNLSGRSAELRRFAWDKSGGAGGIYVQQMLAPNLSGLATTVRGESFLHGLAAGQAGRCRLAEAARTFITDLPPDQSLSSLSGGQLAKLIIACAIAARPHRLAIDGLLEYLDSSNRRAFAEMWHRPESNPVQIHLSDNYGAPFPAEADKVRRFSRPAAVPDLNGALYRLADRLGPMRVRAPALRLDGISFEYSRKAEIFRSASFSFEPGVPYILKAPNGSGKSTLARLLAGSVRPSAGSILVDGRPHLPHRSNRNLLFCSFQDPLEQIFGRSVAEYLHRLEAAAAARPTFLEGDLDISAASLMSGLGLPDFAAVEPFDLPRFVAKRLSVGAAVISRSPWLFFDEPSIGSDREGREALTHLFNVLTNTGLGLILVSHGSEFDGLPGARPITISAGKIIAGGE